MAKPRVPAEIVARAAEVERAFDAKQVMGRRLSGMKHIEVLEIGRRWRLVIDHRSGRRLLMSHEEYNSFANRR